MKCIALAAVFDSFAMMTKLGLPCADIPADMQSFVTKR